MRDKGFLLFEVMVAVMVIGIGLAAVLQSISIALTASRTAKDYLVAGELLWEKMWEAVSKGSAQPGILEGAFKENPAFRYRVEVQEMFAQSPSTEQPGLPQANNLGKVTATVAWTQAGKKKQLSAQTYIPVLPQEKGIP